MTPTTMFPVFGISPTVSAEITLEVDVASRASAAEFDRLVHLYHGNARLFQELKSLLAKLDGLSAYFDAAGHNPVLARARLIRLKARHEAILDVLEENRRETQRLLAHDRDVLTATP